MRRGDFLRVVAAALCVAGALSFAAAQDEGADTGDELAAPAAAVSVDEVTSDDAIAERLRSILVTTGRYGEVEVEVAEGVVFLSGISNDENGKAWATALAERTEGVVAVLNRMEIRERPVWTIEPAAAELRSLWREVVARAPLFVAGVALLTVMILIGRGVSRGIARLLVRRRGDGGGRSGGVLEQVAGKAVFAVILIAGVYLFLRVSGLTQLALTVMGGTGIAGIILGFAFRDIAENFLASLLMSVQRPFRLGDVIEIEGRTGIVQKVTTRGTLLMDFSGNHIQIANATVYKSTIKNFSANPKTRIDFVVGIGYDADVENAQQLAVQVLSEHPAVLQDPEPQALVEELGSATIVVHVYFWIDGSKYSMLKLKSVGMRLVLDAFVNAGVSLPDEAREVVFPQGVPVVVSEQGGGTERVPTPAAATEREARRRAGDGPAPVSTRAEGGLESEATALERQARESRPPDEGSNILAAEGPRRG